MGYLWISMSSDSLSIAQASAARQICSKKRINTGAQAWRSKRVDVQPMAGDPFFCGKKPHENPGLIMFLGRSIDPLVQTKPNGCQVSTSYNPENMAWENSPMVDCVQCVRSAGSSPKIHPNSINTSGLSLGGQPLLGPLEDHAT